MKNGYTLIELMATIVIMAIIALITIPIISDVIEDTRFAGAKASAQGYVDAVKNRISLGLLNYESLNGTRTVRDLDSEIEYRGRKIDGGIVTIEADDLKEARLCVSGYSFLYYNGFVNKSNSDYCINGSKSNFELTVLGDKHMYELVNQYTFDYDLTGVNMAPATNVVCNNNAVPSIVDNTLHIDNIYGPTKCSVDSSVETTFANVDDTTNTILMIANDSVSNDVILADTSDVVLDLNGKTIDLTSKTLASAGVLNVNGTFKGTIKSSNAVLYSTNNLSVDNADIISTCTIDRSAIYANGDALIGSNAYIKGVHGVVAMGDDDSEVIINSATIEGTSTGVMNGLNSESSIVINNATVSGDHVGVINNSNGNISINGGTITAVNAAGVYASPTNTGTVDIEGTKIYCSNDATNQAQECDGIHNDGPGTINLKNEIYIENLANKDDVSRGIYNGSRGTINITGNPAVLDGTSYVSGTMVWSNNGYAVYSDGGTVNINGGLYVSTNNGGVNASGGTLNITNAQVIAIASESDDYEWRHGVVAANDATVNINDNVIILNQGMNGYSNAGVMTVAATSTINITGTQAVLDEHGNYVSGIFIMANSGQGIRNNGTTNVNGATIRAANHGFSNVAKNAIGNIKNADIATTTYNIGIRNEIAGSTINICSSKIYAEKFDISNNLVATVNYSSDVIFTNGTNTPRVHNSTGAGITNSGYICP